MATWKSENTMLTQVGVEILNKLKVGKGSISNIRVVAGSMRVDESQLYYQTKVSGEELPLIVSDIVTHGSGSEISVYITNENITIPYPIHQIGVYITHPDYEGEQLYHISQCEMADFDTIPVFEETYGKQSYTLYLEHANSSCVNLKVDPQGAVKKETFDKFVENTKPGELVSLDTNGNLKSAGFSIESITCGYFSKGKELPFSWPDLQKKIKAGDFTGISIGDYKTITLSTGEVVVMEVAGINTYYRSVDEPLWNHIDFISRDSLIGERQMGSTDSNNGTANEPNPWRASKMFTTLNDEVNGVFSTLPPELKECVIEKRALIEHRYSASGLLTESNGRSWENMGKLWLPSEVEVYGRHIYSTVGHSCGADIQYPIFAGSMTHIIKGDGNGGGRRGWWLSTTQTGNSTNFCGVNGDGPAGGNVATFLARIPLCFRIG